MRILAAGSSGFLGSKLVDRLRADGHQVVRLVRRPPAGPDQLRWSPETGTLDPAALDPTEPKALVRFHKGLMGEGR